MSGVAGSRALGALPGPGTGEAAAPAIDFLVLGAQKCATSWLYYCLREHPGLHLPPGKRELEYMGGTLFRERGFAWYLGLLGGGRPGQKVGDVSVEYLMDPESAGLVQRHAPAARLIVSLRDPVDRAVSAYFWYRRKRRIDPSVSLEDALRGPIPDLLDRGRYDVQLERYLDRFPADRFFVIAYEDVRDDPSAVLRKLYAFLGVDPAFAPPSRDSRPKRNSYAAPAGRLEALAPRNRLVAGAADRLNRALARLGLAGRAPRLSATLMVELRDQYAPHVRRVSAMVAALPAASRTCAGPLHRRWPNFEDAC